MGKILKYNIEDTGLYWDVKQLRVSYS